MSDTGIPSLRHFVYNLTYKRKLQGTERVLGLLNQLVSDIYDYLADQGTDVSISVLCCLYRVCTGQEFPGKCLIYIKCVVVRYCACPGKCDINNKKTLPKILLKVKKNIHLVVKN